MIRKLPLALVILIFTTAMPGSAADQPKQAVYFELLGNGGLYSINYERELRPRMMLRAGIAQWRAEDLFSDNEVRIVALPLMASWLAGRGNHWFEAGGGVLLGDRKERNGEDGTFASLTFVAGYRYQPSDGGFLFRAGLTPFVGLTSGDDAYPDEGVTPSIGISFGHSF